MTLQEELQNIIDNKTKPLGALGQLEEIALQVGLIQKTITPRITNPHIVVFAADHGIAATGLVNPFPQAVTAQMVLNFLNGGAAINVFCKQNEIRLKVVDAGVAYDFSSIDHPHFIKSKIKSCTNNYLKGPAMSEMECQQAVAKGKEIVDHLAASDCNCIGFGEMGIGNTSSATLIMSAILQLPVEHCVGRGTGVDEDGLNRKIKTLQEVAAFHQLNEHSLDDVELLTKVGGFEIAMMTGAYLAAAKHGMVILVDGFIATAALLVAQLSDKTVLQNCLFTHTSGEQGHRKMLEYLHAKPLLNLGLRLGEGTGAALALPLVKSALHFLNEMASFQSAGVSQS